STSTSASASASPSASSSASASASAAAAAAAGSGGTKVVRGATSPSQVAGGAPSELSVRVTSTRREGGDSIQAFTSYVVDVDAQRPEAYGASANTWSVVRRYRDFDWLHARLVAAHRTVLVPPIPDKAVIGRMNAELVELRRTHLDRFLQRVAAHDE